MCAYIYTFITMRIYVCMHVHRLLWDPFMYYCVVHLSPQWTASCMIVTVPVRNFGTGLQSLSVACKVQGSLEICCGFII